MKNKRGMEKEIVKIIIAAIAIVLILVPLAVKIYQSFYAGHTESEQAKEILKQVSGKINAMTLTNPSDTMILTGPNGWVLYGEGKQVCACKGTAPCKSDDKTKACIPLVNRKAEVFGTFISIYLNEIELKFTIKNGEEIVEITQKPATK